MHVDKVQGCVFGNFLEGNYTLLKKIKKLAGQTGK